MSLSAYISNHLQDPVARGGYVPYVEKTECQECHRTFPVDDLKEHKPSGSMLCDACFQYYCEVDARVEMENEIEAARFIARLKATMVLLLGALWMACFLVIVTHPELSDLQLIVVATIAVAPLVVLLVVVFVAVFQDLVKLFED